MKDAATQTIKACYKLIGSSCIDVVSNALKSIGLDPGYGKRTIDSKSPAGKVTITESPSAIPNKRFEAIKNNNENTDVTSQITGSSGSSNSSSTSDAIYKAEVRAYLKSKGF